MEKQITVEDAYFTQKYMKTDHYRKLADDWHFIVLNEEERSGR